MRWDPSKKKMKSWRAITVLKYVLQPVEQTPSQSRKAAPRHHKRRKDVQLAEWPSPLSGDTSALIFGWLVRIVAGSWRSTVDWFVWEKNTILAENLRSFTISHSQTNISLFGRPYRIVDYLLLAGLVWEKNTVPDWKFTIVYEQANRLSVSIIPKIWKATTAKNWLHDQDVSAFFIH